MWDVLLVAGHGLLSLRLRHSGWPRRVQGKACGLLEDCVSNDFYPPCIEAASPVSCECECVWCSASCRNDAFNIVITKTAMVSPVTSDSMRLVDQMIMQANLTLYPLNGRTAQMPSKAQWFKAYRASGTREQLRCQLWSSHSNLGHHTRAITSKISERLSCLHDTNYFCSRRNIADSTTDKTSATMIGLCGPIK